MAKLREPGGENDIYIILDKNSNPVRVEYSLRNAAIVNSSDVGIELIEQFLGWGTRGEPIVDVISE